MIVCDPPDSIENGNVSISSTACGSSVRYQCNVGFRLEGSESRTCLPNGTWSDDDPVCRGFTIRREETRVYTFFSGSL